jgi:hypothetical protein
LVVLRRIGSGPQGMSKTIYDPWSVPSILLVVITCTTLFWLSGFYAYGDTYYRNHKLRAVTRAVALAYVIIGTVAFLLPQAIPISRSVLVLAGLISWGALVGSLLWSDLWRRIISMEEAVEITSRRYKRPGERTVLVVGGAGYNAYAPGEGSWAGGKLRSLAARQDLWCCFAGHSSRP